MVKRYTPASTSAPDLPPVEIGLLQPPIPDDHEGADNGIGLRHIEVPLVVHIARPQATPLTTHFKLHWGPGDAVAFNQIREGDEDLTRIPFTVPRNIIRESWADPVFVQVIRPSGNPSETLPLRLRVNLRRPGRVAPEPTHDGNRNLVLELPADVELGGVSDDRAKLGVEITFRHWLDMAAYDLLRLVWGYEVIEYLVQPADVGFDITLIVGYQTIVDVGDSELLPVFFQVIGPTGNAPDPRAPWSVISWISVYLQSDRLDAPWLEFPDTAPAIDLGELGNQHVKIGLYVSAADARLYERVFLIWAGTSEHGSVPHVDDQTLVGGRTYYFDIPNDMVKAIANGSTTVHYLLEGNGQPTKRSHNLFLSIIGEAVQWLAPWVVEADAGIINPELAKITVRFPEQTTWAPDDDIQITLVVNDTNNTVEYKQSQRFDSIPNDEGVLSFTVQNANLRRFDGLRFEVFYTLLRNGQESLRETYQVGEPKRDMDAPDIEMASSGLLNPDEVTSGAKVFAPFTGTLANDKMVLGWTGPVASTQVEYSVIGNGDLAEFVVPHSFVEGNLDQRVLASYTLNRGLEPTRYSEITSVLIARSLIDLPPPDLLKATITGPGAATLEPLNAPNGSELLVKYSGMHKDDDIQVSMSGTDGDGSPHIPSKPGDGVAQQVSFDISRTAIAANIRNSDTFVTFRYVVTRNGKTTDSQVLTVRVLPIPQEELLKTLIRINEADPLTRILDLAKVPGGATAYIGTWSFITQHWPVWLALIGKKNGVDYPITLLNGATGDRVSPSWVSAGRYEHPVLAAELNGLDHASTLIMEFRAAFSSSTVLADAIVFPRVAYTILKAAPLSIDTSTMILNGRAIIAPGWPRNGQEYVGNAQIRSAQGGALPYTYTSRNSNIAQVTSANGDIRGMTNGSTYIDVKDNAGNTVSYRVDVSNVWQLLLHPGQLGYPGAIAWRNSVAGAVGVPYYDGVDLMERVYGPASQFPVPYDSAYWTCLEGSCDFATALMWDTRQPNVLRCVGRHITVHAWCMTPVRP